MNLILKSLILICLSASLISCGLPGTVGRIPATLGRTVGNTANSIMSLADNR